MESPEIFAVFTSVSIDVHLCCFFKLKDILPHKQFHPLDALEIHLSVDPASFFAMPPIEFWRVSGYIARYCKYH